MRPRPFYARRRVFVALALATVAYRHRRILAAWLARSTSSARRAIAAAELASLTAAGVAHELSEYLLPARGEAVAAHSSLPPRSLRRVLRVAASPDALVVLRAVAGAATREFVAHPTRLDSSDVCPRGTIPLSGSPPRTSSTTTNSSKKSGCRQCACDSTMRASLSSSSSAFVNSILMALDTPHGKRVASSVIGTAVREAVSTVFEQQGRRKQHDPADSSENGRHWLDILLAAGLSDRGKAFVIDVASAVTRNAIPVLVTSQHQSQIETNQSYLQQQLLSPSSTPTRRPRPVSISSPSVRAGTATRVETPAENDTQKSVSSPFRSATSKQLLQSMLAASNQCNWVDRVASVAVRERGLVRDIVRTVASQAIRTYLTTQAELRISPPQANREISSPSQNTYLRSLSLSKAKCMGGEDGTLRGMDLHDEKRPSRDTSCFEAGRSARSLLREDHSKEHEESTAFESLWRLLVRSVASDIRNAWHRYKQSPPEPRWFFL